MTRVATILVNWNNGDDTLECLDSLQRLERTGWDHDILVVDNGSTDGSPEEIERRFPSVIVERNARNLGFTGGNNRGIEVALERAADYVVLLNNDTVIEPGAYDLLIRHAAGRAGLGAVTPLIRYYDDSGVWHAGARMIRPFGRVTALYEPASAEPHRIELFTACCVMFPRAVLERVGTFDDRYFIYQEDTDLAMRIGAAGYELWIVPDAVVYHKVSRSFGGAQSPTSLYYTVRNNLLLIRSRIRSGPERALGYTYVAVLTAKISLNAFTRRFPRKRETFAALADGWMDFARGRWGQRA
jgi:GT2 family glycosyltransferase